LEKITDCVLEEKINGGNLIHLDPIKLHLKGRSGTSFDTFHGIPCFELDFQVSSWYDVRDNILSIQEKSSENI